MLHWIVDAPEWAEHALCAQTDPEIFFPDKGGSTREAKAVCGRCDVRPQCLDYALSRVERFGIWGGTSERERRKIADTVAIRVLKRTGIDLVDDGALPPRHIGHAP